ncbi:tetratricopeptide repeat-containing sensor histidine kinase [Myroides pelagicus]|uniref:Histidine kinase n=1 Tax=Myroides pelagicus TaxID=270914 RepID=A0A7K1GKE9_9FLAO|nr:histidine kinase [Myroides pelagicus]MEC4112884.1 histidine kinase [Myroides pelagicus]MTH28694.1 histidine kinase [Myroides pelagicus]
MKSTLHTIHSSSFILLLIVCLSLFSCKEEEIKTINQVDIDLGYSFQQNADSLFSLNKLEDAFNKYLKSNQYFSNTGSDTSITYNNLRIASIYLLIDDPNSAQELVTRELPNIDTKDNSFKVYIYNTLAICFTELEDYQLANTYYDQSLAFSTTETEKNILKNNIASNYISSEQYDQAIGILNTIINDESTNNTPVLKARILNNLGKALYKKDPSKGLEQLLEAYQIRLKLKNNEDINRSYLSLAEFYLLNNNLKEAYSYANKAYIQTAKTDYKKDKLLALGLLIKTQNKQNSLYFSEYIDLSKAIYSESLKTKNQFAKLRYDFDQHLQEATKLKIDLQQSELISAQNKNAFLFTLILLVVGGVILSFIYYKTKQRHRLEKIQQSYLTETRISKQIHDELANDVFNVLTYIQNFNLEAAETKKHLLLDLESIYNKARNISLAHSSVTTDETFATYLTTLFNEYSTDTCQIILSGIDSFDFNCLDKNQKITIYRVIQELLVNMKKHSMATIVVFKFSENKKMLQIFYSDNGVGIIQEDLKTKNGLLNVETRIKNIGGSFTFDYENKLGIKYNILIPKKNYV